MATRAIVLVFSVLLALASGGHAQLDPSASEVITAASLSVMSTDDDRLGAPLAAADFNCDSFDDLAIGVPFATATGLLEAGIVIVVWGESPGHLGTDRVVLSENALAGPGSTEAFDRFGFALAAGDINGDGCDDLYIGAPGEDRNGLQNVGSVYRLRGGPSGFDPTAFVSRGTQQGAERGYALAMGDFDLDGLADIAVGEPGFEVGGAAAAGQVSVFLAGGVLVSQTWHRDRVQVPGQAAANERFGAALTTGNFYAPGIDIAADLAIGVPGDSLSVTGAGAVDVLYGTDFFGLGVLPGVTFSRGTAGLSGVPAMDDAFGSVLAAGDLDDDGVQDLIVGVPLDDVDSGGGPIVDAGAVNVLFGAEGGLTTTNDQLLSEDGLGTFSVAGARFGAALAIGRLTPGEAPILAAGAPGDAPESIGGVVHLVLLASQTSVAQVESLIQGVGGLAETAEPGDQLGAAIAVGRFNGVDVSLAVGIPFEEGAGSDRGAVLLIPGDSAIFADGFESGGLSAWSSVVM